MDESPIVRNSAALRLWAVIAVLFTLFAAGCGGQQVQTAPELSRWGETSTEMPPAEGPQEPTIVQAPSTDEGDIWIDRIRGTDHRFVVGSIKKDGTTFINEWGNQIVTTRDLNVKTYRSLTFADAPPTNYDPPMNWFAFPLEPGKQWTMTSHWLTPDLSLGGTTVVSGKAGNWEDITVPAGKYHALRVDIANRVFGRQGAADEIDITYWWVPDVNRWVKYWYRGTVEGTVDAEMVSYQPAKAAAQ
jgi:hypothetical protein